MTDTASAAVRAPLLEDALRDAIGTDTAASWERSRHPYAPTVRVVRDGERPIAAALTTRRPSTAATKIVDLWAIDDDAAATSEGARLPRHYRCEQPYSHCAQHCAPRPPSRRRAAGNSSVLLPSP